MAFVATISASLKADTQKFEGGMKRATASTSRFGGALKKMRSALAVAGGVLAGGLIVNKLRGITSEVLQTGDALAKFSDRLGTTPEKLEAVAFAASNTGVAVKDTRIALQRFTRRIADAAVKGGPLEDTLNRIGLSAKELTKLDPVDAFVRLSDTWQRLPSEGAKVLAAFKLFDSGGVALKNTLALGREELERLFKVAERRGLLLDRETLARFENVNQNISDIKDGFRGLRRQVVSEFADELESISKSMSDATLDTKLWADRLREGFNVAKDIGRTIQSLSPMQFIGETVSDSIIGALDTRIIKKKMEDAAKESFTDGILGAVAVVGKELKKGPQARSVASRGPVDQDALNRFGRLLPGQGVANRFQTGGEFDPSLVDPGALTGTRVQPVQDPQLRTTNSLLERLIEQMQAQREVF